MNISQYVPQTRLHALHAHLSALTRRFASVLQTPRAEFELKPIDIQSECGSIFKQTQMHSQHAVLRANECPPLITPEGLL